MIIFLNRFLLAQADFGLVTCKDDEGIHLLIFLHYSDFRHGRPQHLCQTSYFVFLTFIRLFDFFLDSPA